MSNNNENQINDMWNHFLENPMSGMPLMLAMPAMSSTNQGQTSHASGSSNPTPMGPSPPCLVNPYSQAYYNQIGYNPVMGQNWIESQCLALMQAQIQAQMQAQMAFDYHQQQQRPRTSQPPLIINENVPDKDSVASADDDEEEEDEVVEVGRGKRRASKPREKRNWENDDTLLLARCWVHWSQDPVVGNSQTEGTFWKKVVEMFNNETLHATRMKSQIHGK
uniref:glutathione S-transferase T3-like n=1 Tax=Erigeron canadensis TaxID=72917 RepID=UPI001CB9BA3A|nr:glutathione S-transferase T3-like [Erigeron canadensis]